MVLYNSLHKMYIRKTFAVFLIQLTHKNVNSISFRKQLSKYPMPTIMYVQRVWNTLWPNKLITRRHEKYLQKCISALVL